jgi:hypothetical protein
LDKEPIYVSSPLEPEPAPPVSFRRIFRTLRAYLPVIGLSLAAVLVGYVIVAVAAYVYAPVERITSVNFRLEFEGAERGFYPNGVRFSTAEIISSPILTRVYHDNDLGRFTKFRDFANSVFILEANAAQEKLANEYRARLTDARLTSVDRERIAREYELKLSSLAKNEYSVNYRRLRRVDPVPEVVARKVLQDILRTWANFAANEQHVLKYRVAVLSPDVVAGPRGDVGNPIVNTMLLRDRVNRLIENIGKLRNLPNAELARTKDGLSLTDVTISLEEIIRFRIDPLIDRIADAGLDNRAETVRFLNTQLAYDERQLRTQILTAESAQRTLALYVNGQTEDLASSAGVTTTAQRPAGAGAEGETVMPQLSENFIDRLMQLTASSLDTEFRQKLAERYQAAALQIAPLEEQVAYDRAVIENIRTASSVGGTVTRETVVQEVIAIRNDVRRLTVLVQQIHADVSRNLNPSTHLYTATAPYARVERTLTLGRLAQYCLLLMAIALPIIVLLVLLHNRMRQEEVEETRAARTAEA